MSVYDDGWRICDKCRQGFTWWGDEGEREDVCPACLAKLDAYELRICTAWVDPQDWGLIDHQCSPGCVRCKI